MRECLSDLCKHEIKTGLQEALRVREATRSEISNHGRGSWRSRVAVPLLTFEQGRDAKFRTTSLTHPSGLTKTMSLECSKYMKFRKVLLQRRRIFREQELVGKRQPNVINKFLY